MRRKAFVALLIGIAVPLAIRAQQAPMPTVGLLDGSVATAAKALMFDEGLKVEGMVRNRNVGIEVHSADGDYTRLPALAADLVHRDVALVAALDTPAALAIKAVTTKIPIVFAVASDPVQIGLVASIDRPGANITGATDMAVEQERKRVKLLRDLLPKATLFAFLANPANPNAQSQMENMLATGREIGVQIKVLQARDEFDLERIFASSADWRADGLVIGDDDFFSSRSAQLAVLAARRALPAIFAHRGFAAAGGLMSYGASPTELYHQAGVYSGLVLKGGRPADLPVFQTRQTEFIVNLRTAQTLRLAVPSDLLEHATEVIK
ncbi:MAG TPA: ABC transporter substrate-binding protein [Xanthobacteraceae bacterium]|nr:ABC transporter substrate-binding protein [Xanthobacteraceae bacterium]